MGSDVQTLITEHIDLWASAIQKKKSAGRGSSKKHNLYGIKKLRELILELAVRGKLVPQDPSDEPASVLLERISENKKQQIKERKLKKQRALPPLSGDLLFSLPEGWCGCHLGDAYDVRDGTHDSPRPVASGFPLVTSKNLSSGRLDLSNIKYISEDDHLKIQERSAVDRDDILFAMIGSIGNPVLVDIEPNFSIKNVALFKYFDKAQSCPAFLRLFLEHASTVLRSQASGAVQSFVSLGKLRGFEIAFPPLAEQQRIVAKVDELMALCDQLEAQTENNIAAHQVLVETLLGTLTQSQNADELAENWQRLAEHFDTLFTTEHSIDQLKQTILQLAVMGKLVPQDPNDEPASVLLERIAAEKEQLIKDKKIKKQKPLPSIIEDEKLFGLPKGWEWTRFGEIFFDLKYGTSEKSDYGIDGQPILRIPNVVNGYVSTKDLKFSKLSEKAALDLKLSIGDLLIIRSNGSVSIVGKSTVIDREMSGFGYAGYLVRARLPQEMVLPRMIKLMLDSSFVREQIEKPVRTTSGVKNVNSTELGQLKMPVMSLREQHRIVAKVDQLILLCDQLKARLQESQQAQLSLAEAITDQALQG